MHKELSRPKCLTLRQLWREYRVAHPDGYGYSQYCGLYREWKALLSPVMLQEHKAGENPFVDYAGPTVPVWDACLRNREVSMPMSIGSPSPSAAGFTPTGESSVWSARSQSFDSLNLPRIWNQARDWRDALAVDLKPIHQQVPTSEVQ